MLSAMELTSKSWICQTPNRLEGVMRLYGLFMGRVETVPLLWFHDTE